MSKSFDEFDREYGSDNPLDGQALEALEADIRSAAWYVIPSDSLRPSTLESARKLGSHRKERLMIGKWSILLVAICMVGLPALDRLASSRDANAFPTSDEAQVRAMEIAAKQRVTPEWGLSEVFIKLRDEQAAKFSSPYENR